MSQLLLFDDPNVPADVITISQAARLIPPARDGQRTCPSSLARKALKRGIFRLWKCQSNGQWYASQAEVLHYTRMQRAYLAVEGSV